MRLNRPIAASAVHICVDMQKMFMPPGAWAVSWFPQTLPMIVRLVERDRFRTIFTRFIPARRPRGGHGMWRSYYERWAEMTLRSPGQKSSSWRPRLTGTSRLHALR